MTTVIGKMKRQWPENVIMPATARHRMEFWYYGGIENSLKECAKYNANQRDTVEKHIEGLLDKVKSQVSKSYWNRNGHVFALVARNDIGKMANDIYSQYVIHTDKEDVF